MKLPKLVNPATTLIMTSLVSTPVLALDSDGFFELSLEELLQVTIEVATKNSLPVQQTPSSVTVFTEDQISMLGAQNIEELLQFVPGFEVSREVFLGQGFSIAPRGRRTNQNSQDVLFLIDGQRVNDFATGGAMQRNRYISLFNVEQVEVIRGPGSALYGSNAFLGIVNIITKKQGNKVVFNKSSEQDLLAAQISTEHGNWHGSLFFEYRESDGQTYATSGQGLDQTTSDPLEDMEAYLSLQNGGFSFSARYNQLELKDFYLFGSLANDINIYQTDSAFIRAEYATPITTQLNANFYVSYSDLNSEALIRVIDQNTMQSLKDAGLTDGDSAFLVGFDSEEQHMEMGTMFDYVVNDKHKLTAGLEYRKPDHTKQKNRNNYETIDFINALVLGLGNRIRYYSEVIASSDSAETRNREVLGLYIQDEWAVSEQLNLTLGARYDDYSDFGSTLNPRASVNYKASKNWSYKLMYGSAYRAPSNIEQTVKNSPVEIGNVNLQPEEVKTWEASALYQEQDMVFQATLFDNSLSNQIMQIPLEDDPRITYVNLGKANARGLEIEFNYQLFDSWRLSSNYTHYFSRASEGNITANNLASVILAFQQNKFTASLSTTYRSGVEQPLADGEIERLASVTLLNANMRYEISDQLLMSLKIHNLLDRDNRSLSLNTPLAGGVPNKKRSAYVGLEWRF